jgi:hypothetical protein
MEIAIFVSGVITALAGLIACFFPSPILILVFGLEIFAPQILFYVRHWALLIFSFGVLIALPFNYPPVLIAAAIEKLAIVLLIFFGPIVRTNGMTLVALIDGSFAILYVIYLVERFR